MQLIYNQSDKMYGLIGYPRSTPPSNKHEGIREVLIHPFSQPRDLFEAIDYTTLDIVKEKTDILPRFIVGENYSLKGAACDGFEANMQIYKLVKVVDKLFDIDINSVIVKQIWGERGNRYTLTKTDCSYYNLNYEEGLQIFPQSLNWERYKDYIPFDPHNLATTPLSDIDNTIRTVALKLYGFKDYSDDYIVTPSGHLVKEDAFLKSIRITVNAPLVYGNGCVVKEKEELPMKVVYPSNVIFNHGNFISSNNEIYILVALLKGMKVGAYGGNTIDGYFGVETIYLKEVDPNDFFTISWDEYKTLTIEEYENQKAQQAAQREEERKRQIAEEKERAKRKIERVEMMKKYTMSKPIAPPKPQITLNGSVTSISQAIDMFDEYFNGIEKSLRSYDKHFKNIQKLVDSEFDYVNSCLTEDPFALNF